MVDHPLAYPTQDQTDTFSLHDQVEIALAIADETFLKSLLVDCTPPITEWHRIGGVHSMVEVPIAAERTADGIIQYESISCVLADSPHELKHTMADYARRNGNYRGYVDLTRCEAETRTLGQSLKLAQALALLTHAGFSSQQVRGILALPYDAWYKSWWFAADAEGQFTIPFLRLIRTLRYTDGTYTIQYKDFFAQDKPPCFRAEDQKILLGIRTKNLSFRETLAHLNYARHQLEIARAVLVCDRISELEAKGFISQGISIYTAPEAALTQSANCAVCGRYNCPLQGEKNSPVLSCRQFSAAALSQSE